MDRLTDRRKCEPAIRSSRFVQRHVLDEAAVLRRVDIAMYNISGTDQPAAGAKANGKKPPCVRACGAVRCGCVRVLIQGDEVVWLVG